MSHVMRKCGLLMVFIMLYGILVGPFTAYMKQKPIEEKLGYVPSANVLQYMCTDQKTFVSAALLMKVIMYFGGVTDNQFEKKINVPPDYRGMSNIIHSALKLDPYNMDGYYFAQSFLTWDVKQYEIANKLLDYGMKYRTWDWMLPFFAGFNSAYFLKDYSQAAVYYKRAGELSGSELHFSLAGRYMQESGQTELALAYLSALEKGERNLAVKKKYQIRLQALSEVRKIELARDSFLNSGGTLPVTINVLMQTGHLTQLPSDPYGGQFFLEPDGRVATTSKFAFVGARKDRNQNEGK